MGKFQKKIFKEVDANGNVIQHFAIVLYKDNCGPVPIALPTPFTSFLLHYKGKKATSIDKAASCIVPFLNYLFYEEPAKIKNIEDLTLQHGIDYLSSLTCAKKTQNDIAAHLTKFYFFLAKENRLPLVNDVFIINKDSIGREYIANIFEGKYQVTHKQQVDSIHEIKLEYLPLFLQCVKQNNFDIYLGVLFQFCGGLRISEVVSLEYSNVRHVNIEGYKALSVKLQDKDLRADISTAFIAKVKKNRSQTILPLFGDELETTFQYYKEHLRVKEYDAIFIDANNKPMASHTYARKFNQAKKIFIKTLLNSNDPGAIQYGIYLSSYKWSTHIGRGTYSNIIASNANNIGEIAIMRGDSSLSSSLAYLNDNATVEKKVIGVLNEFYKGGINNEDNKK